MPTRPRTKLIKPKSVPPIVMIIDDEESVLEMLTEILTGYHLLPALSGEIALNWVEQNSAEAQKVDVVICDYSMPGKTGVEVLSLLQKLMPRTRLVLLSGVVSQQLDDLVLKNNFDAGIAKPFTVTQVQQLMKRLLPKS